MKIIVKKSYICPVCNNSWTSSKRARTCRDRCIKEQKKRKKETRLHQRIGDSFRLNVCSIKTFEQALIRHVKKTYNVELTFSTFGLFQHLDKKATTHRAPVGEWPNWDHPSYYWGYSGWCEGTIKNLKNPKKEIHITNLIDDHPFANAPIKHPISGIYTSCMNGLGFNENQAYRFAGSLEIFVKDFPKLHLQLVKEQLVENL